MITKSDSLNTIEFKNFYVIFLVRKSCKYKLSSTHRKNFLEGLNHKEK